MTKLQSADARIGDNIWIALRRSIGGERLNVLREKLGGLDIKVPATTGALHSDHFLVKALGEDVARQMVRDFPGVSFYVRQEIPDTPDGRLKYTAAMEQGLSNYEISRALGVSERHVRFMLNKAGMRNPNQRPSPRHRARMWQP